MSRNRLNQGHNVPDFVDKFGTALAYFSGDVAQISPEHDCPLSRHSSADGFDLGPAKGREAVHDGDADLDFGGLAGGVS